MTPKPREFTNSITEADEIATNMTTDLTAIYSIDDALKHVPPASEVGFQVRANIAEALVCVAREHRRRLPSLFVLLEFSDHTMVLALEPQSRSSCLGAIAWQRKGGYTEPMHICQYANGKFTCIETGKTFEPGRSPYTETAWNAFLRGLDA